MSKILNYIFRIIIFITMICALISFVYVFLKSLPVIYESDGLTKTFVSNFAFGFQMFYAALFGNVASIILSLLCIKSSKAVSVCFRTVFMTLTLVFQIASLKFANTFYSVFRTLGKYDFETAINLKGTEPEDVGLTQKQLDAFAEVTSSDNNSVVIFALAVCLAVIVFVILTITSIHSLVKSKNSDRDSADKNMTYDL